MDDSEAHSTSIAQRSNELARLGRGVVCVAGFWVILAVYVFSVSTKTNVVEPPFTTQIRPVLSSVLPEGWGFFTRNPQEADVTLYRLDGEQRWTDASLDPQTFLWNAFGWDRRVRAQGPELAELSTAVGESAWKKCDLSVQECLDSATTHRSSVKHPASVQVQSVCGAVGLVRREPIPWVWWRADRGTEMPKHVVRLEVSCNTRG